MLFVPEPLAIVAPAGSVQLYVVALAIAPTENGTSVAPWHTDDEPVMVPAADG